MQAYTYTHSNISTHILDYKKLINSLGEVFFARDSSKSIHELLLISNCKPNQDYKKKH